MWGRLAVTAAVLMMLAGCADPNAQAGDPYASADDQRVRLPEPRGSLPPRPPDPPRSPLPTPSPIPPRPCPASGLQVHTGVVEAAMGARYLPISLVNCGTRTRTVHGYPAIRVLDGDQRLLTLTLTHERVPNATSDAPPPPVQLAPGAVVVAFLNWRNTVTEGDVIVGRYLAITPRPGDPVQLVLPEDYLDLGTTRTLGTTGWVVPRAAQPSAR